MMLRRGDHGQNVKTVQRALQAQGFDIDDDGDFGPRTDGAVREFQRGAGLNDDGIVGPKTLAALGLDPDSLVAVRGSSGGSGSSVSEEGGGVATITFAPDETDLPPIVRQRIDEYIGLVGANRATTLSRLDGALEQFETTMQFASSSEATPDAVGTIVSELFKAAVDELAEHVPGVDTVKSFYDAASDEIERAARASASHAVGDWIKDQRAAIVTLATAFDERDPNDSSGLAPRALLGESVEETYFNLDQEGRQAFFGELFDSIEQLKQFTAPSIFEFERQLYEAWINGNFSSISDDADGCIECRLEFDDDEFEFESCSVAAPFGGHVADGVNKLIDDRKVPDLRSPLDLKVRRRICLLVDNVNPGGHTWSCGWLDADNAIIHQPVHQAAREGLVDPRWRAMITRFRSAD
jgi:hypothetical protein